MAYPKLVRDKIPEIIEKQGDSVLLHIAKNGEYEKLLFDKLIEEVKELKEGKNREELADILEVIDSISDYYEFDRAKVRQIKEDKTKIKGKFEKKIVIDKVIHRTNIFKKR